MEDLDQPRVVKGAADDILRTLEMLGLYWDGEVLYQSRRTLLYQEALDALEQLGKVYPCGCSRAEIARIASAPHPTGDELPYPGRCRSGLPPGRSPRAYRLAVGDTVISFSDSVTGEYRQCLATACGDFVIKRADGPFAYHLAVVIDDHQSGVNQVVRGADLLTSTPRQIFLQQLLGFQTPSYAHLPLVTGPGGEKLSKRDHAVSVAELLQKGKAARLLTACLRFLGQEPPPLLEESTPEEIVNWGVCHFVPTRIPVACGPLPNESQEQ